ncbi:hypothetical protein D3C73_1497730 [compost metagenome]
MWFFECLNFRARSLLALNCERSISQILKKKWGQKAMVSQRLVKATVDMKKSTLAYAHFGFLIKRLDTAIDASETS